MSIANVGDEVFAEAGIFAGEVKMEREAEKRSQKPRSPSADNSGDQHAGNQEKIRFAKFRTNEPDYNEDERDKSQRQPIGQSVLPQRVPHPGQLFQNGIG